MKAINIIWDVDFEEDLESLPTEIEVPNGITDEEEISDYINVIGNNYFLVDYDEL